MIVVGMLVVTGLAGATWGYTAERVRSADQLADRAFAQGTPCFGAEAILLAGRCPSGPSGPSGLARPFGLAHPFGKAITPAPASAMTEIQRTAIWRDCFKGSRSCTFGPASADVHIVLFGDSHAMQWFPALDLAARAQNWQVTTYLKANCPPNPAPLQGRQAARDLACQRWVKRTLKTITATPGIDAVVVTAFNSKKWKPAGRLDDYRAGVAGYQAAWERLLNSGVKNVIAIRDTPRPAHKMLDCVAQSHVGGADCSRARHPATSRADDWRDRPDPLETAVRTSGHPQIRLLDFTDAFCGLRLCPAVIGNVLVYVDEDHISPTYSRTLGPELQRRLIEAMRLNPSGTTGDS